VKTRIIVHIILGLAGVVTIGNLRAFAQFENSPDHFDAEDELLVKSRVAAQPTKVHYEGKVTLPYGAVCNGQKLDPGRYAVSVNSDGKTAHLTLNQNGHIVSVDGKQTAQTQSRVRNEVLLVRNGSDHRLSEMQVARVHLVFDSAAGSAPAAGGRPTVESLPLVLVASRQ
jgi:hypothetical protein